MIKIYNIFVFLIFSFSAFSQIQIDADFENGNVEIVEIIDSSNTITIIPSLENEVNTTRCWFFFRVYNFDKSKPLTVNINYEKSVQSPNNPVYSYNQKDWTKVTAYQENMYKSFSGIFTEDTVFFATGFPYTYSDLNIYIESIKNKQNVDLSVLTVSESGLNVPKITISDKSQKTSKNVVWIIARQHAFEAHSNFVVEGIVNYLISPDKEFKKLKKSSDIHIVPMMDVDNVFLGASGRMQTPIDFNRDWNDTIHWNAVETVTEQIAQSIDENIYSMFFDIHSTYPGGSSQLYSYFDIYMKSPESDNMNQFWNFYQEKANFKPIKLSGTEKVKGYVWADQFSGNRTCPDSTEFCFRTQDFSLTLECEWNKRPDGEQWTIESLRKAGEDIGYAICKYLLEKEKLTD